MITIRIHNGDSIAHSIISERVSRGDINACISGAKMACGIIYETKGKRCMVTFNNDDGEIITTRVFQEGGKDDRL